jgi:Kef-type K+ transport system membrane component KefB
VAVAPLEEKLDALGYGFFIPVFFVTSGMTLDVKSIVQNPVRLIVFFLLLLVVRGLPSLLVYRRALPLRQRVEMTFIAATTMPLLIALAEIGLSDGVMIPANAAALVGAGVLSVLVFPSIAAALARGDRLVPVTPDPDMDAVVVTEARVVGEVSAEGDAVPDEGADGPAG